MAGKVLIAEDNNDFRELLGMLVTSLGYTAIEARNGIEAIEKAVSRTFNAKPADLIRAAKDLELEGIIAKQKGSCNVLGRRHNGYVCS